MPIKSHTEASPDEQRYQAQLYNRDNSGFALWLQVRLWRFLNYHFSPITQQQLSFFLTFAVYLFAFSAPSVHKTSNYFNYTENSSIWSSSLVKITRNTEKKKKETKKQMLYFF